jgi:putative endonuclease
VDKGKGKRRVRGKKRHYFEEFADIRDAMVREKEIKGWKRLRKISLIQGRNPTWEDLAESWASPFS